ncbi:hypothetical protein ACQCT5_19060 [Sutcliffiella halmapala]
MVIQKKIRKYGIELFTCIAILGAILIISVAAGAVSMYHIYTNGQKHDQVVQFCKDRGGWLTFTTTNGYSGTLKAQKSSSWSFMPSSSNTSNMSCTPGGTAYLKYPNGQTIIGSIPPIGEYE